MASLAPRRLSGPFAILSLSLVLAFAASAQSNYANQNIKWDNYTYKFLSSGQMGQVLDAQGKVVGTILMMNGELQMIPLPGPDADNLKKSFEDWKTFQKRSQGGGAAAAASPGVASPTAPAAPANPAMAANLQRPDPATAPGSAKVTFDDSQQPTVTRPDGIVVTFADPQIKISGYQGHNYILRWEKASGGRFLNNTLGPSHVGTSISGAGEQYLVEGGGIFYDSATSLKEHNTYYGHDRDLVLPKQLSLVVMDALAQVRAIPGHESYKPAGYGPIKDTSEYRLYADGSHH